MNESFEFLKRWHQVLAETGQKKVQIKRQSKYAPVVLQDAKNLQTHLCPKVVQFFQWGTFWQEVSFKPI